MMPLYEGDVRRCRRCKRRRMDDEPPEVQQYKTCAKCRIIERTKKKSRKPLAEETMRYGMRQFQEQSQNSNFLHDDIFSNDQLMAEMQSAAVAHDAQLLQASLNQQQQQQNQQKQPPYNPQQPYPMYKPPAGGPYPGSAASAGSVGAPDAASYSYLYANNAGNYPAPGAPGSGSRPPSAPSAASPVYASPQLAQQMPQGAVNTTGQSGGIPGASNSGSMQYAAPTSAATAAAIAAAAIKRTDPSLGATQALSHSSNHYRQYQQKQQGGDRLRLHAATHCELCNDALDGDDSMSTVYRLCRSCYTDPYARPHVYSDFNDFLLAVVRDKDAESVTYISELASYLVEALSNERAISSEQQFRKIMLDSFGSIYVDPLIGSLAPLVFSRSSHNVSEVNNTAPIISKVSQQYHYTLTPPLRLNYTAETDSGTTTIDMTFITEMNLIIMKKASKSTARVYDAAFVKSLDDKMTAKGLTFTDDPAKIFDSLDLPLSQDQFVKDFPSLQKQVLEIRALETGVSRETPADQQQAPEQNGAEYDTKPEERLDAQEQTPDVSSNGVDGVLEQAPQELSANGSDSATDLSPQEPTETTGASDSFAEEDAEVKRGEAEQPETKTSAQQPTEEAVQVKEPEQLQEAEQASEAKELDPAFAS